MVLFSFFRLFREPGERRPRAPIAGAESRTAPGVDDNNSPIPGYQLAHHGPRIRYRPHRSTAHRGEEARGPGAKLGKIDGRPIGPGMSGRERRELERRAAGGSDTGRRSGELEHGPSSSGAAPGGRKKKGRRMAGPRGRERAGADSPNGSTA